MKKVLISACLLGEKVRYDGNSLTAPGKIIKEWVAQGRVISMCPEVSAGMSIPREPAEISGGDGNDVLSGDASVVDRSGGDVTESFLTGAQLALSLCKENDIQVAVLSELSPSCGLESIYNGRFSGQKTDGVGVTAALLMQNGIKVYNQYQLTEADNYINQIEGRGQLRHVEITKEPVELYKILKFEGLVSSGGEAKLVIAEGLVLVNGEIETRKRKKIFSGDVIDFGDEKFCIRSSA